MKALLKKSAFTLIEIILVALLLSVIAGFAIPNFRNIFKKIKLQNSANHIAYAMRYAQSRAIINNRLVLFEVDSLKGLYWLSEQAKDEEGSFFNLDCKMGRRFQLLYGIEMVSSNPTILFYPDGRIEKQDIKLCSEARCILISTREQRGHVNVFNIEE